MRKTLIIALLAACAACAETVVSRNYIVQVAEDGSTIPPQTVATPEQVAALASEAADVYYGATNILARATECADAVRLFSTNYLVTSTVYVQSIGGVPYDPSNQTITVHGFTATTEDVQVVATVRQLPLVPPALDWRVALASGSWSNISAEVESVSIPAGATNAVAAYRFTLPRPVGGSAFFRVVDNSSGASGSGLWWVVFGGITVDGKRGYTGLVGDYRYVGGILVEPDPLGGY